MLYPKPLEKLIDSYQKLPGIGEKSAERLALASLNFNQDDLTNFAQSLIDCKSKLTRCITCGHIAADEKCSICQDDTRQKNIICILEDYKNVFAFEKSGNYKGCYHVLGGLISPIDNITPDDININGLISRIKNNPDTELIIALKPSVEGETTTLYIKKIVEKYKVKVSRLAYGIPVGADFDYLDEVTLDRALDDRKMLD